MDTRLVCKSLSIGITTVRKETVGDKVHNLHVEILRGLHHIFHHCFVVVDNFSDWRAWCSSWVGRSFARRSLWYQVLDSTRGDHSWINNCDIKSLDSTRRDHSRINNREFKLPWEHYIIRAHASWWLFFSVSMELFLSQRNHLQVWWATQGSRVEICWFSHLILLVLNLLVMSRHFRLKMLRIYW